MVSQLRGWWQRQGVTQRRGRFHNEFTFALLFLTIFAVLSSLYAMARDTAIERLLIDTLTVKPSAVLITLFSPNEPVTAQGPRLVSPFARLSILNGCEGIETMLLLIAAVLAYAAPWRKKLLGVTMGTLLIYTLNQARIVLLYYAFRHDRELFHLLHGYVLPLILVASAGLFFLWWLGRRAPDGTPAPA
jgi:exosortase family protein XrtM